MNRDALNAKIESAIDALVRQEMEFIELQLITAIERIEGRVPSDDEVRAYALKSIFPDGKVEWSWKGICILRKYPLPITEDGKFTIKYDVLK